MAWWQIVLVILIFVILGLVLGYFLGYLIITRLLKKPFFEKRDPASLFGQLKSALVKKDEVTGRQDRNEAGITKKTAVGREPLKFPTLRLVDEIENNRMIAAEPWTGKLVPFQTHVWDTSPDEIHTLPANLRENLTQAYVDIRLANSIVWLSTELGRRSSHLDENYIKLCANIASKLETANPLLKNLDS